MVELSKLQTHRTEPRYDHPNQRRSCYWRKKEGKNWVLSLFSLYYGNCASQHYHLPSFPPINVETSRQESSVEGMVRDHTQRYFLTPKTLPSFLFHGFLLVAELPVQRNTRISFSPESFNLYSHLYFTVGTHSIYLIYHFIHWSNIVF